MGESMKEISIVMRSLGGGGAEKVLVELLNLIDFKNYSVKLLVLYKEGIYINQINKNVKRYICMIVKNIIKKYYRQYTVGG